MTATAGKGPDAFRTISEASSELGVPQHVLRFWETKFDFIQPMKRAGGRRFYRPADLDVLRGVRALLHEEGYTIKGVQRLHKEGGLRRLTSAADGTPSSAPEPFAYGTHAQAAAAPHAPTAVAEAAAEVVVHEDLAAHELLAAAASPAEPPAERPSRQVLDTAARARLTAVLDDLEAARQAIGSLLERHGRG